MRLLLVADLHYSLPQFDWVLGNAVHFDVVVMAGDHLDVSSIVDGHSQSLVVGKYFERLRAKTRVLICSGNHDLDAKSESGEKVAQWLSAAQHEGVLCDGESVEIEDTLFTACPWWDGPIVKAAIAAQLASASSTRSGKWIWVHHAPPANSPVSWGGDRYFGDVELKDWIDQYRPEMVLSGHVHQSPFLKQGSWVDRIGSTWVFNAGQLVRRSAGTYCDRYRRGRGILAFGCRKSGGQTKFRAGAAGANGPIDPRLAQSRGSESRSDPSVMVVSCR